MKKPCFPAHSLHLALCFLALMFFSCKKNKSADPGNNVAYKITHTGSPFAGETLQFHSDVPSGVHVQWLFGDGSTSTDAAPAHVYQAFGYYQVNIVIEGDTANRLGKNAEVVLPINIRANAADLAKLPGTRYWHVVQDSITYHDMQGIIDHIGDFQDTFAVTIVNYTTIVIKGDTLKGIFDSTGITDYYSFDRPGTQFSWQWLHYYYEKDSIIYTHHPDMGGHDAHTSKLPSWAFGITTTCVTHK